MYKSRWLAIPAKWSSSISFKEYVWCPSFFSHKWGLYSNESWTYPSTRFLCYPRQAVDRTEVPQKSLVLAAWGKRMISINSLRLATWKIFQPLVAVPSVRDSVVSDLFIWRKSRTFKTCFELTSIPSFFDENTIYDQSVVIFFFDSEGTKISEHRYWG